MNYNGINTKYNDLTSMARHEESERIMSNRFHHLTYRDGLKTFHHCIKNNEKIAEAFNNFLALREENFTQLPFKNVVLINTALDKLEGILYFSVLQPNSFISLHAFNAQNSQWATITDSIEFDLSKSRRNNHIFYAENTEEVFFEERKIFEISISFFPEVNTIENFWVNTVLYQKNANFNEIDQNVYDKEKDDINVEYLGDSYYAQCSKNFCSILKMKRHLEENHFFGDGTILSVYNPAHTNLLPNDILSLTRGPSKSARQ